MRCDDTQLDPNITDFFSKLGYANSAYAQAMQDALNQTQANPRTQAEPKGQIPS